MSRLSCVTGRFQPVHNQHVELFGLALRESEHLVVAITNPDPAARHEEGTSTHRHLAEANPFTFYERARMLQAALAGAGLADRSTIVPFDLTRPGTWSEYVPLHARQLIRVYSSWERAKAARLADAGYPVTTVEGDPITRISATDVRALLRSGPIASCADLVPAAVVPVLDELSAGRMSGGAP